MVYISIVVLIIFLVPLTYWLLLAVASIWSAEVIDTSNQDPVNLFMIAIPAHNEANVIEATIRQIQILNYPKDLFEIHIVADYCTDKTSDIARNTGAIIHERNIGPKTGKGAALSWLFQRALERGQYDAVVVFDADTKVDQNFLHVMNMRLESGDQVIQGRHIISNPEKGWFPSLTWAMFLVDNRFQNLGRSNLKWSAKIMGDSICFRADVLKMIGWGEGLTEDYQLRQQLLIEGVRIAYEPAAIGYGEAPLTWAQARIQRARWLRGTSDANQKLAKRMLTEGVKHQRWALLDGAAQAYFPSYSTLTLLSLILLFLNVVLFISSIEPVTKSYSLVMISTWLLVVVLLFLYPLFGLALEHAPLKAYLVMLSGPIFIIWRTSLAFISRVSKKTIVWIRTAHGEQG